MKRQTTERRPQPSGDIFIEFPADRFNMGTIEAIRKAQRLESPKATTLYSYLKRPPTNYKGDYLQYCVHMTKDLTPDELAVVRNNSTLVIKLHYLLWQESYEGMVKAYDRIMGAKQDGLDLKLSIPLRVQDICDRLSIARYVNGGYRMERIREVLDAFSFVTSLYLTADYRNARKKMEVGLQDYLWVKHKGGYEPGQDDGDQNIIRFFPGAYFYDPAWRENYSKSGLVTQGILGLQNGERDRAAAFLGGYLTSIGSMNDYKPKVLHVSKIDEEAGIAGMYTKDPQKLTHKREHALEILACNHVIRDYTDVEPDEEGPRMKILWPKGLEDWGKT